MTISTYNRPHGNHYALERPCDHCVLRLEKDRLHLDILRIVARHGRLISRRCIATLSFQAAQISLIVSAYAMSSTETYFAVLASTMTVPMLPRIVFIIIHARGVSRLVRRKICTRIRYVDPQNNQASTSSSK